MYYIIVNPSSKSGRGMQIWKDLEQVFLEREIAYKVMVTNHIGHVKEITQEITKADEIINIIILGGDGTINEALQGIRDFSKVRIGYIPTGSSNDLARAMKLSKNPREILEKILSGTGSHMVDLGKLTYVTQSGDHSRLHKSADSVERFFVVSSGIGFDAAVCEEALSSHIKNLFNKLKLGKLTYLGIALKQLFTAKAVSCDIYVDDKPPIHLKRFLFVASMIHPYEGGGFKFGPDADATDGLMDICVIGGLPKLLILLALPTAYFGKHYIFPKIYFYRATKIEIKTSVPLWVHTDGEVYLKSNHIYLSCEQQKVHFLA
ncbi:MAG: YegS/Rv2252/BmrU family lipid kinase [Lachnospiraceae bacterium]|nr:YegS/Rv2252/BmrU family lipid kinase [Lachnospiraceae bacterium]